MYSNEMKIIYLDTETTGLESKDRLCQVAFLVETIIGNEKRGFRYTDKKMYETLCNPSVPMSPTASEVNNITDEMLKDTEIFINTPEYKILTELNTPDNIFVAHNAPFDLKMLRREGFEWKGKVIDTVSCARKLYNGRSDMSSSSLQFLRTTLDLFKEEQKLASEMNVEIKAHDAAGDVISLYTLTQSIKTNKYFKDYINVTKEELLVKLTDKKDFLMQFIRFGKHNGKTFKEVHEEAPKYLEWIIGCDSMEASITYSAQAVQAK